MNETDIHYLTAAIEVARCARANGNHPFGSILVGPDGDMLLQAENTVVTGRDCTGHAETNLIRLATQKYSSEELARCTVYTSTEPCPMCAGAIYWSKVGRVVYALSAQSLYRLTGSASGVKLPTSRTILEVGGVEVCGPALEEDAIAVHAGFWNGSERGT